MANGVTIPAQGTGDTTPKVLTDDTGATGHAQVVKLGYSADGVATKVPADASGLLVNIGSGGSVAVGSALPAGTNNIGLVQPAPLQKRIQVTPTISTSPAYAAGDVVGGLMTFSNAARISGGSGIVQSVTVLDKTQAQRAQMDLLFFDRSVTVAADNAPVAMSDADMAFCLGVISIGPYNTAWPGTPLNSFSTLINVGVPFVLNGTDLFMVAVARGTPTYTSTSDLIFTLGILQD